MYLIISIGESTVCDPPGSALSRKTKFSRRIKKPAYCKDIIFFIWHNSPPMGHGLLVHEVYRSHKTTHHSRQHSSGRVISSSQRPLPDNTQHSQQTNIHAPCVIRTHNLSRRTAADLRLRPRGHWNRRKGSTTPVNISTIRFVQECLE